jgi:M26 IgA1-specific Metallo-endopeptidase N-terminal region
MPKNILISAAAVLAFAGMAGGAHADLVISKGKTSNVNCNAGVCNATAADAVLSVKDLTNLLATSDVHVFAEGAATDITVSSPFNWANSHQLTLGAYGSLNVKAAISVTGTSGLTIAANVANTGGLFRLVGVGKISFWDTNSTLVINNTTYTLINNLPALIAAVAANPSGTYAFANDYNAAQDGSYPLSPIPTTFTGIFEGLGNAINNLTIYNSNSGNETIALFSQLGATGQLSDVNLANVSIQSNTGSVATLVYLNNGMVTHVSATGAISPLSGELYGTAGLVFDNEGTVTRSHAAVTLSGAESSAGLVAENNGTISVSDASGSVSADFAAGLVLENYGTISLSNASGPVSGALVGGLVQINLGVISTSNASGAVSSTGGDQAGGLVSEMLAGTISNSYALGNVTVSGTDGVTAGGLVGFLDSGSVLYCFATGAVMNGQTVPGKRHYSGRHNPPRTPPGNNLGGLVGYSNGTIGYSYATGSVTGEASPGGEGQFGRRAGR